MTLSLVLALGNSNLMVLALQHEELIASCCKGAVSGMLSMLECRLFSRSTKTPSKPAKPTVLLALPGANSLTVG